MEAETEAVLFERTINVNVITESHPFTDGIVRVWIPGLVIA
jgi:hypothetical protein